MFKSIEELNAAVAAHKRNHKLSKTEIAVLDVLARYSCKNIGKSWLAKSTIARLVGKSRRTVIRACNRLEALGIIRQYERRRETGDRRQTSNLIVIQSAAVTPAMSRQEAGSRNYKNKINTYATEAPTHGALKRSIPAELFSALKPYFNDRDMYKAIGVLYRAKASIDRSILVENHASDFIDGLQSAVFAYKRGKVRNLFGYLFRVWQSVTAEIARKRAQMAGRCTYFAYFADYLAAE
jgi:hypothetical protein